METLSLQIKVEECYLAGKWVMVFGEPPPPPPPPGSPALKHTALSNSRGYSVILRAELKESGMSPPKTMLLFVYMSFYIADARNSIIGNYEKHWPPKAFCGACTA